MIQRSSGREVKSVGTAFSIIEVLQNYDGATTAQLERETGLATSTVHNYLRTLQSRGYVVERDGAYHPGLRLLTHGMAARSRLPRRGSVTEALVEVADAVTRPVWWIVEEHGRGMFVARSPGDPEETIYGRVGKRSFLHTHAPGKAILARMPTEHREDIVAYHGLPGQTKETVTDPEELRRELETVRERGHAVSEGEAALGVRSVGVAFEGPAASVHALGVFGYSHEFGTGSDLDVRRVLRQAADDLEGTTAGEGE